LKLCVSAANGSHRRVIASPSGRERSGLYAGTIAWSPDGRRIAFSSRQGVWTIAPDGSARRLIVPLRKVTATAIAWSPTGRAIAFVRNLALNRGPLLVQRVSGHIYVANADGSGLRRVAKFGFAYGLSWSPNGRSLAWSGGPRPGPARIYTTDVVTRKSTRLATGDWPMFSPDGQRIVFQRLLRGSFMVAVMGRDGTRPQTLGFGGAPVWSPDGLHIAFGSDQAVWVMATDGARRRIVARVPGAGVGTVQWTRG
jgi:Tol biopolymer transport system component